MTYKLITGVGPKFPGVLRKSPAQNHPTSPVTITMPLPPESLSPNARVCREKKWRATKKYRTIAGEAAFAELATNPRGPLARACSQAKFFFARGGRRDKDNLLASLKAAFDGLVDGGLLVDDSGLTHLPVEVAIDSERPRVEITLVGF
jgi:Holliday junction resolvase RusA-like endonuclease